MRRFLFYEYLCDLQIEFITYCKLEHTVLRFVDVVFNNIGESNIVSTINYKIFILI